MNEADAVAQRMLEEDAEDDLDAAENISDTDDIVFYTENMQFTDSTKMENKAIKIKLTESSESLNIQNDFANENEEELADKLKVYDYNETMVTDNATESSVQRQKGTLHVVTDEKPLEKLSCPRCSYTTNKQLLLTRHINTHSNERPFKCTVCDRGFKTNSALMNHTNSHLGKKPHHCTYCEKRFNTGGELARHVRYKHTHEKPHKCGECDYSSVELSKMRRHMRCHTGERPFQCPHCTYASPDTFKLKRHLRTHTGEKPYECDICMARFTQSNSLKSHKLIHSVGERPIFQCTLCPTTCGRKTDLQLHIQKLHTSDHPIKCKRCGKELPDRYTYKVHVKTHEGEKCYRCNTCPYASTSQRHLDMHMLIHSKEKPFICEHCDLAFRQRQLLMRHMNIYHNKNYVPPTPQEKNHICPHCRRAFLRKGNLMRHMELHDTTLTIGTKKIQQKSERKMRTTAENLLIMPMKMEYDDQIINDNSSNDEKNIVYISDKDGEDNSKLVETFEVIYKKNSIKTKKPQADAFVSSSVALANNDLKKTKSETSTRTGNFFIVPSATTQKLAAIKKIHQLPIKIEIGSKDASDTEETNDEYVVIEVIEDDGVTDSEVVVSKSEVNSNIAGDILEIPFQGNDKQDHLSTFGFVDDDEYILPVEVPEDD